MTTRPVSARRNTSCAAGTSAPQALTMVSAQTFSPMSASSHRPPRQSDPEVSDRGNEIGHQAEGAGNESLQLVMQDRGAMRVAPPTDLARDQSATQRVF